MSFEHSESATLVQTPGKIRNRIKSSRSFQSRFATIPSSDASQNSENTSSPPELVDRITSPRAQDLETVQLRSSLSSISNHSLSVVQESSESDHGYNVCDNSRDSHTSNFSTQTSTTKSPEVRFNSEDMMRTDLDHNALETLEEELRKNGESPTKDKLPDLKPWLSGFLLRNE